MYTSFLGDVFVASGRNKRLTINKEINRDTDVRCEVGTSEFKNFVFSQHEMQKVFTHQSS